MRELIYLDNASTTFPKPKEVVDAVLEGVQKFGVNPGRGGYQLSNIIGEKVQECRKEVAEFFNLPSWRGVVFTGGCTDSLNMAIKGLLETGDTVVTTQQEHNSVLRPLYSLQRERQIRVEFAPIDSGGFVILEELERLIERNSPKLVVINHGSNVTGAVQPLREIGKIVRERGSLLLVDGAQTAGAVPIDMERDGVDLLAAPVHKSLYGLMGIGLLLVGERVPQLKPWREGGTGLDSLSRSQPEELPSRMEAGTLNIPGIFSLSASLKYLKKKGLENIAAHHREMRRKIVEGLEELGISVLGRAEGDYLATVSFYIDGADPQIVATALDIEYNIACRAGLHCAPLVHRAMGTEKLGGTIRWSAGLNTVESEIQIALEAIKEIKRAF